MAKQKAAVVLAAGKGKRMKSDLPKVLHEIKHKPMILYVVETLKSLGFDRIIVVVGHKGEMVEKVLSEYPVDIVWQKEQLGTGHAVMMAECLLKDFDGHTLIALGDVPFLKAETIAKLVDTLDNTQAKAACLTAILDDPTGYGRIVRDTKTDFIQKIIEHKDADETVLSINEINTGTFCFDNRLLFDSLKNIKNDNSQGEYYLTDCVKLMFDRNLPVAAVVAENPAEGMGVNSAEQLDELVKIFEKD